MLAKSKLNSIETLMSQTLIELDISHEEFKTIVNEKEKYEQMKENIRNTKNSRDIRENMKIQRFKKKFSFFYIQNGCQYYWKLYKCKSSHNKSRK